MVDLQVVRRARPSIDLVYMLGSCTTAEFRKHHLPELLEFYHQMFVDTLKKLGYSESLYTLDQLTKDFDECYVHGFVVSILQAMVTI